MSSRWNIFDFMAMLGWQWLQLVLTFVLLVVLAWIISELWNSPEPGPREKDDADG